MEIVTSSGQVNNRHLAHFLGHFKEVGRSPSNKHTYTKRGRYRGRERERKTTEICFVWFGFASVRCPILSTLFRVSFEFILFFLNEALPSHCQNIEIKEFSILISLARIVARQKGRTPQSQNGNGKEKGEWSWSWRWRWRRSNCFNPKRSQRSKEVTLFLC